MKTSHNESDQVKQVNYLKSIGVGSRQEWILIHSSAKTFHNIATIDIIINNLQIKEKR